MEGTTEITTRINSNYSGRQGFSKVENPGKGFIRVRGEASDLASDVGNLMAIRQGEYDGGSLSRGVYNLGVWLFG
jgi:hypothetical protein